MTKKDYEKFAAMFRNYRPENYDGKTPGPYACPEVLALAKQSADIFAADNGRFDRARYLKACGVTEADI